MVEVLFQFFLSLIVYMIKTESILYEVDEIFSFSHVTYNLVENLEKSFEYG